jgi:hypothetical protein
MKALFFVLLLSIAAQQPTPKAPRVLTIRLHDVHVDAKLASGCRRTSGDANRVGGTLQCDGATEWRTLSILLVNAYEIKANDLRVRWGVSSNKWDVEVKPRGAMWTAKLAWYDANTIDVSK